MLPEETVTFSVRQPTTPCESVTLRSRVKLLLPVLAVYSVSVSPVEEPLRNHWYVNGPLPEAEPTQVHNSFAGTSANPLNVLRKKGPAYWKHCPPETVTLSVSTPDLAGELASRAESISMKFLLPVFSMTSVVVPKSLFFN